MTELTIILFVIMAQLSTVIALLAGIYMQRSR